MRVFVWEEWPPFFRGRHRVMYELTDANALAKRL
jgi:hypothetical protein